MEWIYLAHDDSCWTLVNTVMNLEVSLNTRNFCTSWGTVSFSRVPLFLELVYGCYAHGNICKLCGWFGNRWKVGGDCDPGSFSPWSPPPPLGAGGTCESLGIRKFYPGSNLVFWPSWVPERLWCEQDGKSGTLSIWTHTRRECKCIAGWLFTIYWFKFMDYGLLFVLIWDPGLPPFLPQNGLVFVFLAIFLLCNLLCSFVFHFTHFILFHILLLYFICLFVLFLFYYWQ